ncbi:MAG: glycosyltransferase family 2 protein [Bacteroidota bacterium]
MIDVLIPTYNRCDDLLINLLHISNEINSADIHKDVAIIICDNASTDTTRSRVEKFAITNPKINIVYHCNEENIGLERNAVRVLSLAKSEYILFCGDDDLIHEGYLAFCMQKVIEYHSSLGCIIPGIKSIDRKGNTQEGRITNYDFIELQAGYSSLKTYSHMAHQMSGLLVKRDGLLVNYLARTENRNPYLFIFFVAFHLFHNTSLFAPRYKTAVQVDNEKDWGYNEIGLLDEVFKSYYYFDEVLSPSKLADLLVHFIRMHSYRLNVSFTKPSALFNKYKMIVARVKTVGGSFRLKLGILLIKEFLISLKNET